MDGTQLLKGVLPIAVLAAIEQGQVYGYGILRLLRSAGFAEVGDASVYGTLQRLFADGLVSVYLESSDRGPARKCYTLTSQGAAALKHGRASWSTFRASVDLLLKG